MTLTCRILAVFSSLALGSATSFLEFTKVTEAEVEATLVSELGAVDGNRLAWLQATVRPTFDALPKNAHGNLGHHGVRYILHRFFVHRYGWYIRGLDPKFDAANSSIKEWVPTYLQTHLEERLGGQGATLHDLTVLAAALEDLSRKETGRRLEVAYKVHGFATADRLHENQVRDVITTYMMQFLLAGNFSSSSQVQLYRKKQIFAEKYTGWHEAEAWLWDTIGHFLGGEEGEQPDHGMGFDTVHRMAVELGDRYHSFNDLECQSLKGTLRGMEGNMPGRVRLSIFYQKGLYSHWRFTEKVDYLRSLGVLDEADPEAPRVIVPNYITSRGNCLAASSLYELCCRNECEDLLSYVEQAVGAPDASPEKLLTLVASLPSDTVQAPRVLPEALVARLGEVAARNGGRVPIHGRLFSQWMHHAYPRECPYPHEAGATNPMTPEEWIKQTGHESSVASAEERQSHVDRDTCAASGDPADCTDEASELPWSATEELLIHSRGSPGTGRAGGVDGDGAPSLTIPLAGVGAAALALLLVFGRRRKLAMGGDVRAVLVASTLVLLAHGMDILDGATFVCALLAGPLALASRVAVAELHRRRRHVALKEGYEPRWKEGAGSTACV